MKESTECEYCHQKVDFTESTSELCNYCENCHKLVIGNCKDAIEEIRNKRSLSRRKGK